MSDSVLFQVVTEGLYLSLLISLPILVVSLLVGLLTGILQTATQLQEQTLSFVPRLAAVFVVVATFGSWMGSQLLRYTLGLWQLLGDVRL